MRLVLMLVVLLVGVIPTAAQQLERNPEYDQYLIWTVDSTYTERVFYRAESPVQVCQDDDYGAEWNDSIQTAITEMASVVPSVYATTANCDIRIVILDDMPPDLCWRANGTQASGCTVSADRYLYPVNIYIERYTYHLPMLLHELMHAYGVWTHPDRSDSVVSANPDANWFLANMHLTEFDKDLLAYLYDQPAFAYEDQAAMVSVTEAYDRRWCDSVEDMFRQHRITLTEYERFRCG